MGSPALLTVLAVTCMASLAYGMFEDQAGSFDWYKQQIGLVERAAFHSVKPRVCVSTQQSAIGCLNLRDGSPAWRKLIDSPAAAFVSVEYHSMAVTVAGGVVRAFDFEGYLKWEQRLSTQASPDTPAIAVALPQAEASGKTYVPTLVYTSGYVKVYDTKTGRELQGSRTKPLKKLGPSHVAHALIGGGEPLLLAYQPGSSSLMTHRVSTSEDTPSGSSNSKLSSPQPLSRTAGAAGSVFVALSEDAQHLCYALFSGATPGELTCSALPGLLPSSVSGLAQAGSVSGGLGLMVTSSGVLLFSKDLGKPGAVLFSITAGPESQGAAPLLKVLSAWADVSGSSAAITSDKGEVLGLVHISSTGAATLHVVSASTGVSVLKEPPAAKAAGYERATADSVHAALAGAFLGTYRKKDRTDGYRVLLSFRDGRLALLQQGVLVWSRDEALAAVTSSVFMELPAPRAAGAAVLAAAEKADFKTRLRAQVLGAKVQLKLDSPGDAAELTDLRALLSDRNTPTRDVNGFRRMLLLTTQPGKLLALHNGDGRVLWSRNYPEGQGPLKALSWRTFHDISHSPQVLLLHPGHATVVDAHTGAELQRINLPFQHSKVVTLHARLHDGTAEQALYMLVAPAAASSSGSGPRVHLLPDSTPARTFFAENYRSLYLWEADSAPSGSAVHGYGFGAAAARAASVNEPIFASPAWQLDFGEPVLATAARDAHEPIMSSVKVMPDRSIKHRYLSPNTLLVATGAAAGTQEGDVDLQGVTLHVLDSVTGRVLHRQLHAGARGPVTATLTENTALVTYWDGNTARYAASSLELYDASPTPFSVLDYLFNPHSVKPTSAFNATAVEVITQVYGIIGYQPRAITVTRTEQGITLKQFLVTTQQDQVYALDPRLTNPRRPKKAKLTAEEQEDQLIPYQEMLPLQHTMYATLDKQVLGLSHVNVEPTRLESTCLVLMHGVDLFYTRLKPARAFDALEDDFNYVLLIVALAALTVGSVLMHYAVKQAGLKRSWK